MTLVDPEIDHRLAVHWSSCNVGSDRPSCWGGRPVRFGFAGTIGREGGQHDLLKGFGVLWESNHPALASGNLPMRSDQPPRGGDHIEAGVTKTPTNANLGSYHPRWHRITVAPHRHQPVRRHFSDQGSLRWIRHCGKGKQRFSVCQLSHRALGPPAGVAHRCAENVEAVLRLGHAIDVGGAPPTLGQVMDSLLDYAFAVRTPRWAGVDPHPVVFEVDPLSWTL